MKSVLALTDNTYNQVISEHEAVLVEFWAEWCPLCKQMKPILEEIQRQYEHKLTVAMVNVETEEAVTEQMGVMSLPALFIYKKGNLVGKVDGYVPKETLTNALDQVL